MRTLDKQVAKRMVQDGINFQKDVKIARSDQSAEEMHLNEREAIQRQGDDVVPLNVPEKQKMEEVLRQKAEENKRYINKRRGFAPKGMRNIAKVSTDDVRVEKPGEVASETSPGVAPVPSVASPDVEKQPYVYTQGDEFLALSKDWQGKSEQEKPIEIDLDDSLKAMRDEVFNVGEKYAKVVGEVDARQGVLWRIMGKNPEKYQESQDAVSEWKQKQKDFGRAFYKNIQDRLKNREITPEYADEQTKNFDFIMANHVLDIHGRKFDFKKDFSEGKNWLSSSVAKGYNNFVGKFRKMSFAKKAALGTGIFLTGNIAAIAGWRIVGGLAAGKGAHEGLQAGADWWRQRKERKETQEFEKDLEIRNLSVEDKIYLRLGRYERKNNNLERRMAKYARGDYYRKFASFLLGVTVGTGTIAKIIQGTGMGGAIREKIFGGGAAATQAQEAVAAHTPEVKTSGGLMGYGSETGGHDLVDAHPEGKYGPNFSGSEASGHEFVAAHPEGKYGPGLHGSEGEGHIPEPEKINNMRAPDASEKIAELVGNKELGYSKVYEGGGIEKSAQDIIRANPKAFGLDPNDPRLHGRIGDKAHELTEGLRTKLGLKHGIFDRITSHNIQSGDEIRVFQDSSGKMSLTYNGRAFGNGITTGGIQHDVPDVSSGGAGAAHEIAPSKPNMAVDDVKPRASIAPEGSRPRTGVADHQPSRGGGKMKFSPEIEEMDRKAAASAAKALESQQHADNLKAQSPLNERQYALAHVQQVNETGKLLCRVFEEAGVSKWANALNHPMSEWKDLFGSEYQISQEVRLNDATEKVNLNLKKLRELYPILRQYQTRGTESIGECLFKAMKDPANVLKINMNVLTSKH